MTVSLFTKGRISISNTALSMFTKGRIGVSAQVLSRRIRFPLYELLPLIMRLRDNLTKQSEGILERIVGVIEDEAEITDEALRGLINLIDSDTVDVSILPLISHLVGGSAFASLSEKDRRFFVSSIASLWKIKGTRISLIKLATAQNFTITDIQELYKAAVNETIDYSDVQDGGHPFNAARIDVFSTYVDQISGEDATKLRQAVEEQTPVHVLLRSIGVQRFLTDILPPVHECQMVCESYGEETDPGPGTSFRVTYLPEDTLPPVGESALITTCFASVENP